MSARNRGHQQDESATGDHRKGRCQTSSDAWDGFVAGGGDADAGTPAVAADCTHHLMHTLHNEIIPRLLRSHRSCGVDLPARLLPPLDDDQVDTYMRACLDTDASVHEALFNQLRDAGHDLPSLYLGLLTPAARLVGRLWETDDCTFPEVTLALWRIQGLVRSLQDEFCEEAPVGGPRHRILLTPVPGSQHTLGFYMLSQFFRRDGWEVSSDIEATAGDILGAVGRDWFDVVALSLGSSLLMEGVPELITALRPRSMNPAVCVMVGGPLRLDAARRRTLGADAFSGDAPEALRAATELVRERRRPN